MPQGARPVVVTHLMMRSSYGHPFLRLGVLTGRRWRSVIDFAHSVDARIVTSFGISAGTRDANGGWQPDQAERFINFTRSIGGSIAAAEMVEPHIIFAQPRLNLCRRHAFTLGERSNRRPIVLLAVAGQSLDLKCSWMPRGRFGRILRKVRDAFSEGD